MPMLGHFPQSLIPIEMGGHAAAAVIDNNWLTLLPYKFYALSTSSPLLVIISTHQSHPYGRSARGHRDTQCKYSFHLIDFAHCPVRPSVNYAIHPARPKWQWAWLDGVAAKESKIAVGHLLVSTRYVSISVQFRSQSVNFPFRHHYDTIFLLLRPSIHLSVYPLELWLGPWPILIASKRPELVFMTYMRPIRLCTRAM